MKKQMAAIAAGIALLAVPIFSQAEELPLVSGVPGPFLTQEFSLGNGAVFRPIVLPEQYGKEMAENLKTGQKTFTLPMGQLVVEKGVTASAWIIDFAFSKESLSSNDVNELFVFDAKGQPGQAAQMAVGMANMFLMGAENLINAGIQENIAERNKTAERKIPANFAHVSIKDLEYIRPVGTDMYTMGGRIWAEVDGFLVPAYFRAYLMKKGNEYRGMAAITSDAEKEMVKEEIEKLAKASLKM